MIINSNAQSNLPFKDLNNVYVVADFDRTITTGNSQTSWAILADSNAVPESYALERKALYEYYRPLEISEEIDYSYKMEMMYEWFSKHIELFIKYKMPQAVFEDASKDIKIMQLRPHLKDFFKFLNEKNIPLIIISAGIGNFIESFLKYNDCYYDNIYISSNKIIFENGIAIGVDSNIIHSFNKNEVSLPTSITQKLKNRDNVVLLGDQISDLKMVNKNNHKLVISIGLTSNDYPLDLLVNNFDIVCEKDDGYDKLQNILFCI